MTKLLTRPPAEVALPPARRAPPAPPRKREATRAARLALVPPPQPPTVRCIRDRAYFIYLERDGRQGDAAGDWLQAERELWASYRAALDVYMHQNPRGPSSPKAAAAPAGSRSVAAVPPRRP